VNAAYVVYPSHHTPSLSLTVRLQCTPHSVTPLWRPSDKHEHTVHTVCLMDPPLTVLACDATHRFTCLRASSFISIDILVLAYS
jgi:hypothetical protein